MEQLFQSRVDLIPQKMIRNEILRNEINSSKVLFLYYFIIKKYALLKQVKYE